MSTSRAGVIIFDCPNGFLSSSGVIGWCHLRDVLDAFMVSSAGRLSYTYLFILSPSALAEVPTGCFAIDTTTCIRLGYLGIQASDQG